MRRVIFYLFFDAEGKVDDFVQFKLSSLRNQAEHIFVVSNSPLDEHNRARLESVADTVWERENSGFDVGAYRDALERFGVEELAGYDELIMMNCTFFGPVGSFDPVFERMDADPDVDFWGITDHDAMEPHPFMKADRMEAHIQSHWIGVRSSMFTTAAWHDYWEEMPPIRTYVDSVNLHEGRFTVHFLDRGFTARITHPAQDYASYHPLIENAEEMLRDGCPIVKRRSFFSDPLYLERRAVDGRSLAAQVEASGYPMQMLYSNLARTSEPRVLATNLAMLELLPDVDLPDVQTARSDPPPRIAVVAHVDRPDLADELFDRLHTLPGDPELVVTVPDVESRAAVRRTLESRGLRAPVRILGGGRGRDVAALFIGCRDLIQRDDLDLIVRVHTLSGPVGEDPNRSDLFRRQLLDNLLASPAYVRNLLRLFDRHASLGMVFPPAVHIGYPTLGHGWAGTRELALAEAKRLGLGVPFDVSTPLAAYGGMFVARPAALRPLADAGLTYERFSRVGRGSSPLLADAVERLVAYAALSHGWHVRQVLHPHHAAVGYSYLEYKYQAVSAALPARPEQQLAQIRRLRVKAARLKAHRIRAKRVQARRAAQPGPTGIRPTTSLLARGVYRTLMRR